MNSLIPGNKFSDNLKKSVREFFASEDGINTIEIIAIVVLALTVVGAVTAFLGDQNEGFISEILDKVRDTFNL